MIENTTDFAQKIKFSDISCRELNIAETVIRMRNTGKFTEEDISLATGLDLEAIRKIK